MSLFSRLLCFIQPWRADAARDPNATRAGEKTEAVPRRASTSGKRETPKHPGAVAAPARGIQPLGTKSEPDRKGLYLVELKKRPETTSGTLAADLVPAPRQAYVFHDNQRHVVIAHLVRGTAWDYTVRDTAARAKLKPKFIPIGLGKPYDRTHLVPFGFHGSENDPFLVVPWDPAQNQGPMNKYEQDTKKLTNRKDVIWCAQVDLGPHSKGAVLSYYIYDPVSRREIRQHFTSHMKCSFKWYS